MSRKTDQLPVRFKRPKAGHQAGEFLRGFSLLELLIVISIIAGLLALTMPALKGVHLRSKKTLELSNLRQVGVAWFLYAQANNDHALPGYLEPPVQEAWDVSYDYLSIISRSSSLGETIPPEVAAPWTWRLLPYMNDAGKILRAHLADEDYELLDVVENAQSIALEPAFGYNGYYIGGYWAMVGIDAPRPSFKFANSTNIRGKRVNVVARSPSAIRFSEKMLVFCSTTLRMEGVYQRGPNNLSGFHLALPPTLADVPQWRIPGKNTSIDGSTLPGIQRGDTYSVETMRTAPTPLGRYTGAAVVFYADGHTDSQTPGALSDQSIWINGAERVGDIPARDFTHTDSQ